LFVKLSQDDESAQIPPPKKQNPLLRNLEGNHPGRFKEDKVPSIKQDNLLRQLSPGHTGAVDGIEPPSRHPVAIE